MFELEEYSSGFHDGFLSKYADSSGPTLDFCISDSLQDMLDIDIRSEIANVVGGHSNEIASLVNEMPSSLDHAIEALTAIKPHNSNSCTSNSNLAPTSSSFGIGGHNFNAGPFSNFMSSPWFGMHSGSSWSSSNDYFADVGACVDPNSVMPLISSSMIHNSPKVNLNANVHRRHASSPPPPSPNVNETKSHLTFSPAQVKVSANALRNEQITSHIPKQIVAISSSVTAATMAPATMATNSMLQRKQVSAPANNPSVDAVKKDLGAELRRATSTASAIGAPQSSVVNAKVEHSSNRSTTTTSNTIKLAPGIGGLTFANTITYNKLKQQTTLKSPQGSPITTNGAIVLKRERDSSPLPNMATLTNGGHAKLVNRNVVHNTNSFTPKSIASAQSPVMQSNSVASSATSTTVQSAPVTTSLSSPSMMTTTHNVQQYATLIAPISATVRGTTASARSSPIPQVLLKTVPKSKPSPCIESEFPKPAYSYSCLIAIALKNSRSGSLPVSEIYSFMCEHFPYFKTAPSGWKNSVRHNLSLNRCFEKIEKPATNGNQRKGCLWAMKPDRIAKMDEEVLKWSRKDPMAIRNAMVFPENLEALERGEMKHGSSSDSDVEADSQSEIEETSDLEEQELDDTIVENMFVEEDVEDDIDEEEDDLQGDALMSDDSIMVMNAADSGHGNSNDTDDGNRLAQRQQQQFGRLQQQQKRLQFIRRQQQVNQQNHDFDIEVEDIYDAIDIEDDKEVVQRALNGQHCLSSPSSTSTSSVSDIIELGPADLNVQQHANEGYQSPKRARLNINYSIGPAGELEKHMMQQQQQLQQQHFNNAHLKPLQSQVIHRQTIRPVKLQSLQPTQPRSQHIIVQTISAGASSNGTPTLQTTNNVVSTQSIPQFQQITAIAGNNNRRKVQLVNRIA